MTSGQERVCTHVLDEVLLVADEWGEVRERAQLVALVEKFLERMISKMVTFFAQLLQDLKRTVQLYCKLRFFPQASGQLLGVCAMMAREETLLALV